MSAPETPPTTIEPQPTITRPAPRPPKSNGVTGLLSKGRGGGSTPIPPSLQAKMAAMANRASQSPAHSYGPDSSAAALMKLSLNDNRAQSFPAALPAARGRGGGLANRRTKKTFTLSDIDGAVPAAGGAAGAGLGANRPSLGPDPPRRPPINTGSPFANFGKIVDPSGKLNFNGKAVLHASGVDFSNGASFAINMDQLELYEELGKGNYGTVKRALHKPTNVAMAMKEIRLELDSAKLAGILMELDILHRAIAPTIVEFYGAFFIESCVYYCMEYMDARSLDRLCGYGVPEDVLARISASVTQGLKFLKDELQVMHRDVKPTNVLVNTKGEIKLCDFGVSGQLEKSMAKTNIGCQSYMAPERIKGESQNNLGTYSVSSDVWSLGLSMIEVGMGHYPYPPETYSNVFAQLTAIVHGDPPELPEKYSETARNWVAACLVKEPNGRATYSQLLAHSFLVGEANSGVDMVEWVAAALAHKATRKAEIDSAADAAAAATIAIPATTSSLDPVS